MILVWIFTILTLQGDVRAVSIHMDQDDCWRTLAESRVAFGAPGLVVSSCQAYSLPKILVECENEQHNDSH